MNLKSNQIKNQIDLKWKMKIKFWNPLGQNSNRLGTRKPPGNEEPPGNKFKLEMKIHGPVAALLCGPWIFISNLNSFPESYSFPDSLNLNFIKFEFIWIEIIWIFYNLNLFEFIWIEINLNWLNLNLFELK